MTEAWDIIFPAAILNSSSKHCNAANPYAGYEMLAMPHLEMGDKVLFVARVTLYESHRGSEFIAYDKPFRPEMYKHCRDGDEEIFSGRNFWYFEEIQFQRRGKISESYYQRLLGAVHILHETVSTMRPTSSLIILSSLGSLYAKKAKKGRYEILDSVGKQQPRLLALIEDAYKSYV